MPPLNPVRFELFEKFLLKIGCIRKRQKGSHIMYTHPKLTRPIVVPERKEVPPSIIRSNLRTLEMSTEEFLDLLKRI